MQQENFTLTEDEEVFVRFNNFRNQEEVEEACRRIDEVLEPLGFSADKIHFNESAVVAWRCFREKNQ